MTDERKIRRKYGHWRNQGEGRALLCIQFSLCEGLCPSCGIPMILYFGEGRLSGRKSEHNRATFDHVEALCFAKEHNKFNVKISCYKCNHDKGLEEEAVLMKKFAKESL